MTMFGSQKEAALNRVHALSTVSIAAIALTLSPHNSHAADAPTQTAQAPVIEEITITATRVIREGYEAPTPTTIVGIEELNAAAPANVANFLNTLPSLAGSVTPRSNSSSISADTAGVNNLNLRGLGISRTLVLLDGQRVVGSTIINAVDVNEFPEGLISRVDVVTGGASAAYGSDALSGVVNFILDKKFTGVKGDIMGGVTTYGDDRQFKLSLVGGTAFANDRGHFLISGDISYIAGVQGVPRPWYESWQVVNNPAYTATNGQPRTLVRPQAGLSQGTAGALVVSGPLRGLDFGPGGVPRQFNFGSIVADPMMIGGDWKQTEMGSVGDIEAMASRRQFFTRASFDLADNVSVFVQLSSAFTNTQGTCCLQFNLGTLTIRRDNAFLPAAVGTRMDALGLTSLLVGSINRDLGGIFTNNRRNVNRGVIGAEGKFDAFETNWTWNAYYQKGIAKSSSNPTISLTANYNNAIDAVINPANGAIVCRSTLASPGNGCVPYNILGVNVNSQAAKNYVIVHPFLHQRFTQDVAAGSVQGEPFSSWAGPVSVAAGVEYRRESVTGVADSIPTTFAANFLATSGAFDVFEGFAETVVPLAKNTGWAKAFDLNAAVRVTDYSTSGRVVTWKVGATYAPADDLNFRATRSRDIRAPNLNDLFQAGQTNTQTVSDPFRNGVVTSILRPTIGNPALKPEKADTTGVGIVYQPAWFQGFSASVDYFNIDIAGAIAFINQQQVIDRCFAGATALCSQVTRDASGVVTQVVTQPVNLVTQVTRGLDIEASYRTRLDAINADWSGNLSLRVLGTQTFSLKTNDGIIQHEYVGEYGSQGLNAPHWRWLLSATYDDGPIAVTFTERGVSGGVYDTSFIECTSGCPVSTAANTTIDNNQISHAWYSDLSVRYKFISRAAGDGSDVEGYITVDNLTNKDPPVVAGDRVLQFISKGTNPAVFDTVGRAFRAGIRFKM